VKELRHIAMRAFTRELSHIALRAFSFHTWQVFMPGGKFHAGILPDSNLLIFLTSVCCKNEHGANVRHPHHFPLPAALPAIKDSANALNFYKLEKSISLDFSTKRRRRGATALCQ